MRSALHLAAVLAALLTACEHTTSSTETRRSCEGGGCVVAIAASRSIGTTCAVIEGGEVRCWGSNTYGQLGTSAVPIGADQRSLEPVSVSSLSGASAIGVGELDGCAVVGRGEVECWGDNSEGQLGAPTPSFQAAPRQVRNLTGAAAVSPGMSHVCALVGGSVRCWGYNADGELGDGTTTRRYDPVTVSSVSDATAIATGGGHTCALVGGGAVKCWGADDLDQLGNASVDWSNGTKYSADPVLVTTLIGATAIASGSNFSCALLGGGTVKCWGGNEFGQLGDVTRFVTAPDPVTVGSVTEAVAITAGLLHACALLADGSVKCWGWNAFGQLGNGRTKGALANGSGWIAEEVTGLAGVSAISAGARHSCALQRGGGVKCWGYNASGQLGDGTTTDRLTPVDVVF